MSDEVLVKAEGASKKFCRSLKRSLWYGVQDVTNETLGREGFRNQLRKNEFWAVDNVSFELKRGDCLGLIGPNGAGKSTLLKMLNGLIKPDIGRIALRGRVGALIELGAGFNPILTARENIFINGSVLGFSQKELDSKFDLIVDFSEIEEFLDTPVQNLSSGMKVRLGFAIATQLNPSILLVDEILAVGDISFRMKCFKHILKLQDAGTTIVLVSHSMIDINRVCNRVLVMSHGEAVADTNVSRGTAIYMRECDKNLPAQKQELSDSNVEVIAARIIQDSHATEPDISTGDCISIELEVGCVSPLEKVRIWLAIQSSTIGLVSAFSSIEDGEIVELSKGTNRIALKIPNLPLRIGHYFVSAGIYGPEIDSVYDFKDVVCEFSVIGPRPKSFGFGSGGVCQIPHDWEIS